MNPKTRSFHVVAHTMFPVFMAHTEDHGCDDLCMPVTMTTDEYMDYLQAMAAFKDIQEKIGFPIPDDI